MRCVRQVEVGYRVDRIITFQSDPDLSETGRVAGNV